jgi:hypothetical protein
MGFKILIGVQMVFAINVEAPLEIAEQILAYANETDERNENIILRVDITKNMQCNAFTLKLIDKRSGKIIKEIKFCSAELPNIALQNAVFKMFGHNIENRKEPLIGETGVMAIIGIGFAAAGLILYYSNPPKPVYGYKTSVVEK